MKKIIKILVCFSLILIVLLTCDTQIANASEVDITSKSAILMENDSGEILFSKDETKHLPVASMVKMMTILISLEELDAQNINLDTMITTSENASGMGGSQVFIDPYVDYSFEDLLKSVIVASANDASVALAEYFNGNEKAFTNRMNKRAKELGMNDTNYSNCTGLPASEQYSCAKDTAILLREILKHDIYHKYSTIWMDELTHPSGRKTELTNTNRLIRYYQGCDSGKTGSTNEAGCCLGASAKRGDMRLVSVVIGAQDSKTRFNESAVLFNYGFGNFESKKLVDASTPISNINVSKGRFDTVGVIPKESFTAVVKKGDSSGYKTITNLKDTATAKINKGDKLGEISVLKDGNLIKKIDIVSNETVERQNLLQTAQRVIKNW